jgi:hypothetical protein
VRCGQQEPNGWVRCGQQELTVRIAFAARWCWAVGQVTTSVTLELTGFVPLT